MYLRDSRTTFWEDRAALHGAKWGQTSGPARTTARHAKAGLGAGWQSWLIVERRCCAVGVAYDDLCVIAK